MRIPCVLCVPVVHNVTRRALRPRYLAWISIFSIVLCLCLLSFLYFLLEDLSPLRRLTLALNPPTDGFYVDDEAVHSYHQGGGPPRGYLVWSPQCRIPDLDPWHFTAYHQLHQLTPVVCSTLPDLSRLTGSTLHIQRHLHSEPLECCYQEVTRTKVSALRGDVDNLFKTSKCHPLRKSVNLTSEQEFILVKCVTRYKTLRYINAHARVPIREDVRRKLEQTSSVQGRISVLILGIDSVSRLNLLRTMPQTVAYLRHQGWTEMKGYSKVGENTFPNVMALLTGLNVSALRQSQMFSNDKPLDHCPFVWREFSARGYVTAYGEDAPAIGTFNYNKVGFFKPPTDYYLRPFMLAVDRLPTVDQGNVPSICRGPNVPTDYIFNYAADFASTFKNTPFFAFFWMNTLTHENTSYASALDERTLTFFKDLTYDGVLNTTVVVFLSDHGFGYGDIRATDDGYYEDRLPFLFIWMPENYRRRFPQKYLNLLVNRERLVTPFDLHLTLRDLLNGDTPTGTSSCRSCVSMFDQVPWNRSCSDAGIFDLHFCACSELQALPQKGGLSRRMAQFVVHQINMMVRNDSRCAQFRVQSVRSFRGRVDHNLGTNTYVITFIAAPGSALFEATVGYSIELKILGPISRLNNYGTQSRCTNRATLKKYCVCKEQNIIG